MPLYIAFEGGEGSGKSTQARRLARRIDGVLSREPGGTSLGSELRRLLLSPDLPEITPRAEALLMAADRAEHVELVVRPALAGGRHVVSDRSVYSSLAYQGGARGLGLDAVGAVNGFALDGLLPDLVILLDVDPTRARQRMEGLPDRLEAAGDRFHDDVERSYAVLAERDPARFRRVDANGDPDLVEQSVWDVVAPLLESGS